jgi:hypothetical protein
LDFRFVGISLNRSAAIGRLPYLIDRTLVLSPENHLLARKSILFCHAPRGEVLRPNHRNDAANRP